MTSHFKTGRFGRGPTEQRPRLSPTRTGGRSLRSEGRVDYESEGIRNPVGGDLLFPSTYFKSDRSDRSDLQMVNQRVTEVGFSDHVRLKRPKRPVIYVRFAVPHGVICAPPAPKSPRERHPRQVVVSFKRGSAPITGRAATGRPRAGVPRTVRGTSYGGKRMAITGSPQPSRRAREPRLGSTLPLRANRWVIVAPCCRAMPTGAGMHHSTKGGDHESRLD